MLDAEEIHRQAEKERLKDTRRKSRKGRRRKGPSLMPVAAESRKVFHRIYPHNPNILLWVMLPLILAITGWVMMYLDWKRWQWMLPYAIGITLIPVLVYVFTRIREMIDYITYRTWRNNLGFPVNGWDRLGQSPNFPRLQYWDASLIVEVRLKPAAGADTVRLVDDLLFLFTKAANSCFYVADQVQAGLAGDIRNKWIKSGYLEVAGSADGGVMGELYLFIHKKIRALHQGTGLVEAVNLKFSKNVYQITPVQTSD